jgi:hypothetical protein
VRTPYVADVQLLQQEGSSSTVTSTAVLAHTPALDCAGMIVPGARVHMTANAVKAGQKTTHAVQVRVARAADKQVPSLPLFSNIQGSLC